jgi:hypothetical protein
VSRAASMIAVVAAALCAWGAGVPVAAWASGPVAVGSSASICRGPLVPLPEVRRPSSANVPLPSPPELSKRAIRDGDAFTVWGAFHHLRSPVHGASLRELTVTVVGHVVGSNFDRVPRCALHRPGKADPPGCVAPLPEIVLADDPTGGGVRLSVLGFASNWAQLVAAEEQDRRAPAGERYRDMTWAVPVPRPLPPVGARVRVSGRLDTTFSRSASGLVTNPNGILTYEDLSYVTPPKDRATLGAPRR